MKRLSAFLVAGTLLALAACSSSSTSPTPTPPPSFHIYTADFLNPGTVSIFTSPLSNASVPGGAFAGNNEPASMTFDSTNRLFVTNFGSDTVQVFSSPIANGATPAFTLSTPALQAEDAAFDPAGNLFVTGLGNIAHFTAPLTNASTVDFSITNVDGARSARLTRPAISGQWRHPHQRVHAAVQRCKRSALQFAGAGNQHGIAISSSGSIFAAANLGVAVYKTALQRGDNAGVHNSPPPAVPRI